MNPLVTSGSLAQYNSVTNKIFRELIFSMANIDSGMINAGCTYMYMTDCFVCCLGHDV